MSFFLTIVILTIVIIGISLIFMKKKHFMYLIPIVLIMVGMILFAIAFVVGGWGGVGLVGIGTALFTSSAAALIIVTLISYIQTRKQS